MRALSDDCFKSEKSFPAKLILQRFELTAGGRAARIDLRTAPSIELCGDTTATEDDFGKQPELVAFYDVVVFSVSLEARLVLPIICCAYWLLLSRLLLICE